MQTIHAIQFEGGPEDGRILSAAILKHVFDPDRTEDTDIRLFLRPDGESGSKEPVLLGRYVRTEVADGRAVYRWNEMVE